MRARALLRLVAALAGLAGASFVATPALATVTTESFTFFNSGTPIATGMISYTPNVGTISSFSNANLINFDIYFNALPGPANTYSLVSSSPLSIIPVLMAALVRAHSLISTLTQVNFSLRLL